MLLLGNITRNFHWSVLLYFSECFHFLEISVLLRGNKEVNDEFFLFLRRAKRWVDHERPRRYSENGRYWEREEKGLVRSVKKVNRWEGEKVISENLKSSKNKLKKWSNTLHPIPIYHNFFYFFGESIPNKYNLLCLIIFK